jgi:formylglycine-generating enzyme required for sulfatase activity
MADKNDGGEGDNYPMYAVRWHEAVEYCNKRSRMGVITSMKIRE